jgi:hypothetical protein
MWKTILRISSVVHPNTFGNDRQDQWYSECFSISRCPLGGRILSFLTVVPTSTKCWNGPIFSAATVSHYLKDENFRAVLSGLLMVEKYFWILFGACMYESATENMSMKEFTAALLPWNEKSSNFKYHREKYGVTSYDYGVYRTDENRCTCGGKNECFSCERQREDGTVVGELVWQQGFGYIFSYAQARPENTEWKSKWMNANDVQKWQMFVRAYGCAIRVQLLDDAYFGSFYENNLQKGPICQHSHYRNEVWMYRYWMMLKSGFTKTAVKAMKNAVHEELKRMNKKL